MDEIETDVDKPWGKYSVVGNGKNFQVKVITINPHSRLSLQKHHYRSESWYIVEGNPTIQLGEEIFTAHAGSQIYVPKGAVHRIAAHDERVVFVELQSGTYYGEDDIVRLEDDYER